MSDFVRSSHDHPDLNDNRGIPKTQEPPTGISGNRMTGEGPQNVPLSGEPKRPAKVPTPPARPDWLPETWKFDYRLRLNGITAGTYDRFYIEPVSKRKFRSRKEVDYFIETECLSRTYSQDDVNEVVAAGFAYDPMTVPETVKWSLVDASTNSWTASIGPLSVDQKSIENWKAHFNSK